MSAHKRLLASTAFLMVALGMVLSTERRAEAAAVPALVGWCDEGPVGGGSGHEFGDVQGGCYKCSPHDCHSVTLEGYCHEWHSTGSGCPQS